MRPTIAITLFAAAIAAPAHADKADKLFDKGKKLLAQKKYADACETFEKVDRLEPAIGAKLNVARCYEEWGRLATAYLWYVDAEKMAVETKDKRLAGIEELVAELDVNVPRVTIRVPEGADPEVLATLTLDGKPLDPTRLGVAQRVDPGPHVVEFVVDDDKKRKMIPVERGGESEVTLDIPKGTGKKKKKKKRTEAVVSTGGDTGVTGGDTAEEGDDEEPTSGTPGRTQRIAGISLAAGGGIAVGVATFLTLSARSRYADAIDTHCMGSTTMCNPEGLEITRDARSTANLATVITLAGGAAIAGGVVLYLLAPKAASDDEHALYLTPTVGDDGGGFVFGGRY